jgi:hypothetical protein
MGPLLPGPPVRARSRPHTIRDVGEQLQNAPDRYRQGFPRDRHARGSANPAKGGATPESGVFALPTQLLLLQAFGKSGERKERKNAKSRASQTRRRRP